MYVAEMPQVYVNLDASELPLQVAEKNYFILCLFTTLSFSFFFLLNVMSLRARATGNTALNHLFYH